MTRFMYKGRNQKGSPVTGIMDAESPDAVALRLSQAGVIPITITRERVRIPAKAMPKREQRVRAEDLIFFTRQMTTLVKAGISLTESLDALQRETPNPTLRAILDAIQRRVEGGMSFSEALTHHPRTFSEIYIQMVRAAEEGGFLDQALDRVGTMLENDLETRRRVSAALRYPAFVLMTLGIGIFILISFVIPKFATFYSAFSAKLPLPTRMVLGLGSFMSVAWPALLVGAVLSVQSSESGGRSGSPGEGRSGTRGSSKSRWLAPWSRSLPLPGWASSWRPWSPPASRSSRPLT